MKNVQSSLKLFGSDTGSAITDIVISSNVSLGHDNPADAGVSVWFTWEKEQRCIPVDKYKKVQENLQAIHFIIESRRTELRHGGLHILRQAFAGFKALPPASGKDCWSVLGIPITDDKNTITKAYKALAKIRHPDDSPTGSAELFRELNDAYQQATSF